LPTITAAHCFTGTVLLNVINRQQMSSVVYSVHRRWKHWN